MARLSRVFSFTGVLVVACVLLGCSHHIAARGCGGQNPRPKRGGDPTPYCHGDYEINQQNCEVFGFQNSGARFCNRKNKTSSGNVRIDLLDPHTVKMIELISNVFENGDTTMGYAYIDNLGDGRGFTSGYLGFCTGTGDAYAAVQEYQVRNPDNILAQYLPRMKQLSDSGSGSTSGLGNYKSDWVTASCQDPVFVQTQLDVGRSMNLKPAIKYATTNGVNSNLGKAIFYDTVIEQGIDCDTSSGDISIDRLLKLVGSKDPSESEQEYLSKFLKMRRQMLCCFPDDVWPESADRVSDLQNLVENWSENQDLQNPVELQAYTTTVTGDEQTAYDTANCPSNSAPAGWKLPAPTDLPIPNLC